jgi:hypothetical protein
MAQAASGLLNSRAHRRVDSQSVSLGTLRHHGWRATPAGAGLEE